MTAPTVDDYALALTCGLGVALYGRWKAERAPPEDGPALAARLHDLAELLHAEGAGRQRTVAAEPPGGGLCWVAECDGGIGT